MEIEKLREMTIKQLGTKFSEHFSSGDMLSSIGNRIVFY